MWHCIDLEDEDEPNSYNRTTLHRGNPGKYRGAFMAPGSDNRRMWVLNSPQIQKTYDTISAEWEQLLELDTVTGDILQTLIIEDCIDGHDVVRIAGDGRDSAFVVDTRHGHIVEIALPASSQPFTESSIRAGASVVQKMGYVDIIKRHTGFTRADHVNNVAIHPQLLISNLHGKDAIVRRHAGVGPSPTRLSALDRLLSTEDGRELTAELDGFESVQNVGTWCHGIAFWEDTTTSPTSQIKLISLDSKHGTLVSVVLSGPNAGFREVLWAPDEDHPVLVPPKGVANRHKNGAKIFSKGLAVQGGVAYFGVSYARAPQLRQSVPESLLVAVDLAGKNELWVRTVRSNGLINQILTKSSIGEVQLPPDVSSVELTYHGCFGQMVEMCEDLAPEQASLARKSSDVDHQKMCAMAQYDAKATCGQDLARILCCACNGGKKSRAPLMSGVLDMEIMKIEEEVNATATFIKHNRCLDVEGHTKHLPLVYKRGGSDGRRRFIATIADDLNYIVKHLCHLNIEPLQKRVMELGDMGFTKEFQLQNGNSVVIAPGVVEKIKRDVTSITLIFSSKMGDKIYHMPWLNDWLPMLEKYVLGPLGVPANQIIRMQFANMPQGSDIDFHLDKNAWVGSSHRVHVPIITHPDVFFLTQTKSPGEDDRELLRIKANVGEAYEFNNAMPHAVHNLGPSRVHLIIDWVHSPIDVNTLINVKPGEICNNSRGNKTLRCAPSDDSKIMKEEL